jgi:hypothetical protein
MEKIILICDKCKKEIIYDDIESFKYTKEKDGFELKFKKESTAYSCNFYLCDDCKIEFIEIFIGKEIK